jgi:hypothetical protein
MQRVHAPRPPARPEPQHPYAAAIPTDRLIRDDKMVTSLPAQSPTDVMLLIDAANVVGSRPDGWWRDRPLAARTLVARVRTAAAASHLRSPVVIVLEGAARRGEPEGVAEGVEVVHASGEGDDTLVRIAAHAGEPVLLVTSDRALRERARSSGADVVGPAWLLSRLESSD